MKKLITKFLGISCLAMLVLSSCKKDGALVTEGTVKPGALNASATTMVLNSANLTSSATIMTFTFTQPSFGFAAGVSNTLQIDAAGDNWANPYSVSLNTNVLTQGFNTADFNNILLKLGLKGGVAGAVNVRISSSLGTSVAPTYSNVLALTLTPFNLKSWLYITGQFSNWVNPGAAEDSLYSATSNGIYVGVINFPTGSNQFLILPKKNWDNKYATSQSTTPTTTVTLNAANNINAPSAGSQYLVSLNVNTGAISFTAVDYYSVIGDAAQGWNAGNDVAMKYVNDGTGTWTVSLPLVSSGMFKVRQDNAWTNSWGIPNSGSAGYGVANTLNNSSNSNIPVPSNGTYTVNFIAPATTFGTTVGTAAGNNPIVTTTYSVAKQ